MEHFLQPRDPRFRRRINEIGQSIEDAEEAACSSIYIFGQNYVKPCFQGVAYAFATCIDASCPSLNLNQRDRLRRQRGRSRGRAELSFDFYDDWDDLIEGEGLLGWGGGEALEGNATGGAASASGGYGTLSAPQTQQQQQPARQQKGMSYSKGSKRRKSVAGERRPDGSGGGGAGGKGWLGRLFAGSGKAVQYQPSAADLQENPGSISTRWKGLNRGEDEALLADDENGRRNHRNQLQSGRHRSGTASSGTTEDSLSSRGDLFPSDEEDDAVALDDEFAMVLERRTTQSNGGGPETESSTSGKLTRSNSTNTNITNPKRRGKRPSMAGSRSSTRRTMSSRSDRSSAGRRKSGSGRGSRRSSNGEQEAPYYQRQEILSSPMQTRESDTDPLVASTSSLAELKLEEQRLEEYEEEEIECKRDEARRLAGQLGLAVAAESSGREGEPQTQTSEAVSSKEATPRPTRPTSVNEEPSQLPTPVPTDDEEDEQQRAPGAV